MTSEIYTWWKIGAKYLNGKIHINLLIAFEMYLYNVKSV